MLFTTVQQTLLLAAASTLAAAKNIKVQVGAGGLNYSPNNITAAVGDVVDFTFTGKAHDVATGPFSSPCQPATSGGFYSGFMQDASSSSPKTFSVTIQDTKPIWFYCSATSHCQGGMVGVINPPTSGANTLAAYKEAAAKTSSSSAPANVFGGSMNGAAPSGTSSGTTPSSTTKPNSATARGISGGLLVAGLGAAMMML